MLHYYPFKRVYQIHETGDRQSIHKKIYNSERKDKSNNSKAVGVRCDKKRDSVLILLLRGVS